MRHTFTGAAARSRRDFLRLGGTAAAALAAVRAWPAAAPRPLRIGLVLVSPAAELGWTKQHTLAAAAVERAFGAQVQIDRVENVFQPQDAERVFRGLAASGHGLILGTSFSHSAALLRVAPQFPTLAFDCCAGPRILANLGAFEARYHEGLYLAGVAAARVSKTGRLGYIGGFPIPDIVGPGNAFLRGAQSVRPGMTCNIVFLNSWEDAGKEKEAALALIAQGCDVLASLTDSPVTAQTAEQRGVWSVGYASDVRRFAPLRLLTSVMLDWSGIYVQDAKDVLAGTWKAQSRWWGLKEGVVRMAPYLQTLDRETLALLARQEAAIKSGTLHPFGGEVRDQSGAVRIARGVTPDEQAIRSMNWLVAGMQGRLKS